MVEKVIKMDEGMGSGKALVRGGGTRGRDEREGRVWRMISEMTEGSWGETDELVCYFMLSGGRRHSIHTQHAL